jgi:peptide-methionine (S)-S-oxide reductase
MQTEHHITGRKMYEAYPEGMETAIFGLGCFWGAERLFWELEGVFVTSVGYAGGQRPHPSYEQVCTGATGHAEVVQVVFDPDVISFEALLKTFFEGHDPTQGNRQGNDVGSQYRSVIYTYSDEHLKTAMEAKDRYDAAYLSAGRSPISTEIQMAGEYYPAEDYHQQYLAKNPAGYCGIGGTGVVCPIPVRAG